MRIERAVNYVTALGPGKRLCVWVNGCSRGCPGCVSPRLQKADPETEVEIPAYFADYRLDRIDGVTVSGGEPFEQAEELAALVCYFRERGVRDILVYSGYTLDELTARNDAATNAALRGISVLIDGPYVRELDTQQGNLAGSSNQKIHYFDASLRPRYEAYAAQTRTMQEMTLGNTLLAVGIPDAAYIEKFKNS